MSLDFNKKLLGHSYNEMDRHDAKLRFQHRKLFSVGITTLTFVYINSYMCILLSSIILNVYLLSIIFLSHMLPKIFSTASNSANFNEQRTNKGKLLL